MAFACDSHHRLCSFSNAYLDLADAFAADAINPGEFLQRFGSSARRRSVRMCCSRSFKLSIASSNRLWRISCSSALATRLVLKGAFVRQPILPLALAVLAHRHRSKTCRRP